MIPFADETDQTPWMQGFWGTSLSIAVILATAGSCT